MTGPFETLIYTDCPPGGSISGAAGLQFQSRSPAADENAMALVRNSLLYEAPDTWMRDRRPVADYPPSFSHAVDRGYTSTAAGIYLGREVSGGREGNQLTHGIVTADRASYGPYRPAQLFGASFWTQQAAPARTMPRLEAGWSPGWLDIDRLATMVRNDPSGRMQLASLLAALSRCLRSRSHRVMLIGDDCGEVVKWIAAATVLLPQESALRLGFKVFTNDPARARQPIVAVHADTPAGSGTIADERGYAVFDLLKGVWPQVDVAPWVYRNVDLFLTEDPYDVVDAIEIAAQPVGVRTDDLAWTLGAAIALRHPPVDPDTAPGVIDWIINGDLRLRRAYLDRLVSVIIPATAEWPWHDVAATAAAVEQSRIRINDSVRLALLSTMIQRAEPPADVPVIVGPAENRGFSDEYADAAAAVIREALTEATPERFAVLLEIARLFGIRFSISDLPEESARFVADWADHAGRRYRPERWLCGQELVGALISQIDQQVRLGTDVNELARKWRPLLDQYPLPVGTTIGAIIVGMGLLDRNDADRAAYIRRRLGDAGGNRTDLEATIRTLWRNVLPTEADVVVLDDALPPGLRFGPEIVENYADRILAFPDLANHTIAAASQLIAKRRYTASEDLRSLLLTDIAVRKACGELPLYTGQLPGPATAFVGIERRIIALRHRQIVDTLMAVQYPPLIISVLKAQPMLADAYFSRLLGLVRIAGPHHNIVAGFYFLHAPAGDPRYRIAVDDGESHPRPAVLNELRERIRAWVMREPDPDIIGDATHLISALGPPWVDVWANLVRERKNRWRKRRRIP